MISFESLLQCHLHSMYKHITFSYYPVLYINIQNIYITNKNDPSESTNSAYEALNFGEVIIILSNFTEFICF